MAGIKNHFFTFFLSYNMQSKHIWKCFVYHTWMRCIEKANRHDMQNFIRTLLGSLTVLLYKLTNVHMTNITRHRRTCETDLTWTCDELQKRIKHTPCWHLLPWRWYLSVSLLAVIGSLRIFFRYPYTALNSVWPLQYPVEIIIHFSGFKYTI